MTQERFDSTFRVGDAVTIVVKVKPFIDVSIPPSANDYQNVSCVKIALYDPQEDLVEDNSGQERTMTQVPNRPGWYFYRYQTTPDMQPGLYTAIATAYCRIDGQILQNRNVQEFRLVNDGIA